MCLIAQWSSQPTRSDGSSKSSTQNRDLCPFSHATANRFPCWHAHKKSAGNSAEITAKCGGRCQSDASWMRKDHRTHLRGERSPGPSCSCTCACFRQSRKFFLAAKRAKKKPAKTAPFCVSVAPRGRRHWRLAWGAAVPESLLYVVCFLLMPLATALATALADCPFLCFSGRLRPSQNWTVLAAGLEGAGAQVRHFQHYVRS